MMHWFRRWWNEGDGDRSELSTAEDDLRKAVSEHTEASIHAKVVSEIETKRTSTLINTVEKAIEAVKREE